jgi:ATP-dependent Clp protease protease subunit
MKDALAAHPDLAGIFSCNDPMVGGAVNAIKDAGKDPVNDIVTVGIGMAASMGQFLLSSGTKGKRYATPNTRVLLHQPSGGFGGTASDIQTQAELIMSMKRQLSQITADQTGKTVEEVMADGDRDRWFTAQEALEYGFIDHIQASAGIATGVGTK